MRLSRVAVGALVVMACITDPGKLCGCQPVPAKPGVVTGHVLGPSDAPASGALVNIERITPACTYAFYNVRYSATSAADGRFERNVVGEPGLTLCFRVWADPAVGSPLVASDTQTFTVAFSYAASDTVDVVLRLKNP